MFRGDDEAFVFAFDTFFNPRFFTSNPTRLSTRRAGFRGI